MIQRADDGKYVNLLFAIDAKTITSGLNYALATGNWDLVNTFGARTGVSQVLFCSTCGFTCLFKLFIFIDFAAFVLGVESIESCLYTVMLKEVRLSYKSWRYSFVMNKFDS